jgi:hypothetical protein
VRFHSIRRCSNPQPHEIATPQFAIDCEIEECEVASTPLKLEPNADGPDLFRFERAFLTREASLVPRSFCKANERWDRGAHGCFLGPTASAPAQVIRRPTAHNLPMSALAYETRPPIPICTIGCNCPFADLRIRD